ncbi:MAG: MFS family permease [Acidimicrobiales bacterium]
MARRRIFHGWKVVGAGAVLQALQSGLFINALGHYAVLFHEQFGWNRTTLSVGYALNRVESGLLGPVQGKALDRFGTRSVMRVGVVLLSIGFMLFSQIEKPWHYFGALVVMAVGASLCGFLSVVTATVRWFERKRARALSVSSLGFALGGTMIPVVVLSFDRFGWRPVAFASGLIILIVGFPLTWVFGGLPADRGQFVDGVDPVDIDHTAFVAEGVSSVHFTASEAIRTRAFWMISFGHASALLVVGAVTAHLALFLTDEQGYTKAEAAFVAGGLPLLQLVGMLAGGYLGDRVNKRLLASIAMLGHMVGMLLLTYATSRVMVWAFVPFHGLAWGLRGPLMQALRADYFGSTSFGAIMGLSSVIVMLGTAGGPLFAGILADATGSFRPGFTILALMAGAGMIFFVLATPPSPPVRGAVPAPGA